jgi:hypothetical protein
MSRVVLSEIEEGDALAITAINDDITALAAASALLDHTNVAEQGLDDRVIAVRSVTPADGTATNTSFTGAGPYTTSDVLGVTDPVQPDGANDLVIGPFVYNSASDHIKVRLSFDFTGAIPDGVNPSIWVIQFGYATDWAGAGTGTFTWLTDTVRKVAWHAVTATDGRICNAFTLQHLFQTALNTSTLYIGARIYQEDVGNDNITMSYIFFYGKLKAK